MVCKYSSNQLDFLYRESHSWYYYLNYHIAVLPRAVMTLMPVMGNGNHISLFFSVLVCYIISIIYIVLYSDMTRVVND